MEFFKHTCGVNNKKKVLLCKIPLLGLILSGIRHYRLLELTDQKNNN
jgi:hypothetical protein